MDNKFRFEQLTIYQEAQLFANDIYVITKTFPKEEIFGLTNQLRRAAVSISLNIAEGSSRTKKDFAHFLDLSKGSCFECVSILTVCLNQNYIVGRKYSDLYEQLNKLSRMISKFQISLRRATSDTR